MNHLSNLKCEACNANAKRLTSDEIQSLMPDVEGWDLITDQKTLKLKRVFATKNYTHSVLFTNVVAELAEAENHHPLIILEYASVTVYWWTHKINGLHKNDFIMAYQTSLLFQK
ncbi:MAG: 4a-hydroxytetrahydrobiopterin dehydratase [Bacteroidales bacterium]|nr:4a-hydroxytetrahydrobiopterin dehydratase [Bacteroidales bacterium]